MSLKQQLIPVHVGNRIIERCGAQRALALSRASNVSAIRARKSGEIVRLEITPVQDGEDKRRTGGSSRSLTYDEALGGHAVVVLKRYDGERFVVWTERDQFTARRFNPDLLPGSKREERISGPSQPPIARG